MAKIKQAVIQIIKSLPEDVTIDCTGSAGIGQNRGLI